MKTEDMQSAINSIDELAGELSGCFDDIPRYAHKRVVRLAVKLGRLRRKLISGLPAKCPHCQKSNCPGAQRADDCPTWESRTAGETEYVARKEDVPM